MIGPLIKGAIQRRKVVLAITLVASLFGLSAYLTLPREANPDITFPFISVTVPYPGVSPEDSERLLVRPLEVELQSIEGIEEMNGVAGQNYANVTLEFPVNFNKEKALNDIRAKVDMAKGRFPPDAEEPIIEEYNANQDPVLNVVLSGSVPERQLFRTAQDLKDRIETLPGVLRAELYGAREEVLEVTIDPLRMEAYNITAGEIANVIRANNQLVPAGNMENDQGRFAVKIPGVVEEPVDILTLPIKTAGDRVVTLGDVADVRRTFKEAGSLSRVNGERSMSVDVIKRQGANILETVADVRKLVDTESKAWPEGTRVTYTFDSSEDINRTLTLLESGLIIAVILVMIIIVASLGVRAGMLVGAAIPACFMVAFLLLQTVGITLNMMVMFGLVLAVGMLVDGSIVVVEYADRKLAEGFDKKEAYKLAGERMFWPVFNGIATTLCAFVPFLFWNSIPGKFMSYLPITLFFVLGSSILIALIFTPALGSVFGKRSDDHDHQSENIRLSEEGDPRHMTGFMGRYANFLWQAIHRPVVVMVALFATIGVIIFGFASKQHRTEFFLDQDPEWATVYVKARGNLSTPAMNALVTQVEQKLQGVNGVENMFVRVGRQGGGLFGGAPADTIGSVRMDFVDFEERQELGVRGRDLEKTIRERVGEMAGLNLEVRTPQGGPQSGKDVQVELRSSDNVALNQAADIIQREMIKTGDLHELEDSRTSPGLEWNLTIDREAAGRYGVSVASVGQAIQFATNGVLAGRFRPDDSEQELDIRVRFPADARNLSTFDQLKITTPNGAVPASYFVKREAAQQVTTINRRDGQRVVVVQANAKDREKVAANQIIAKLRPTLEKAGIASSVNWKFQGADEETKEAGMFFLTALAVSLFLMSVILLWQFNSFWGVFCTLFAVVLSTVGVLLGIQINLLGTFDYISIIMTGTGVVALAGVIVGHNIVLVDTYYQLVRAGVPSDFAALRSAAMRFRPVLLTTLTAVVGLLPLMFQLEPNFRTGAIEYKPPGSEWWVQMAGAIVWGLSFSTFLTLLVTPAMLALPSVAKGRFGWVKRGRGKLGKVITLPGKRPPTSLPEAARTPAE
jgi:multidrug efflux pump